MGATTGIKAVARLAGVSVGTVSNVLNHPERVAEATRLRVRQAIAELGFVRNDSARQLRAGNSRWCSSTAAAVPLSSVRQPREQPGRTATELLLDEIETNGRHQHRHVLFQPEPVVRASTAEVP